MAVQFKFRSSVNFESVAIDGRASISVRDLKSKIIRHKNLNLCQDSELVFSDAVTGQEYNDESIQIPCGSSVVIKRVPAGSVHVNQPHFNSCQNLHSKDSVDAKSPAAPNAETVDFDDFGVDLYPIPKETLFSSDLDTDKDNFIYDYQPNTDNGIKRYSEPAMRRCLKLEASGISDAIPGVHAHSGVEQIILPTKSKPEEEDMNVERVGSANALDTQHANLSSELKCSLCNVQHPNAFSWNAAIRGYSESKNPREAIVLYKKMLRNGGSRPDNYTYPLLMKVCANLSLSFVGGEVLGHVMQLGLYLDIFVHNAVIHKLVSCRELEAAQKVFDESCVRDLVSWNSLINGYVRCGLACEALRIYREMEVEGVMPDEVTMIGVVSSCAQLEDLSIGRQFHWLIEENGLSLTIPLANVLMDMYVKCGNLEVARAL